MWDLQPELNRHLAAERHRALLSEAERERLSRGARRRRPRMRHRLAYHLGGALCMLGARLQSGQNS